MISLEGNNKIIVYSLVFVVIVAGAIIFFYGGSRAQDKNLDNDLRLAEAYLRKNLRVQNTKDDIIAEQKRSLPFLKLSAVKEMQVVAELLKEVESVVRASGASIVSLSPDENPEEDKFYKKYRVELRLDTDFAQLLHFLSKLKESKLLMKIDDISIASSNLDKSKLRIDVTISLAVPL